MTTYENLVYPTLDSYDSIQNVLLIDQVALQSQVFYDSANATSYPILYNSLTKREDLSQLLTRFTHLDRIAFVFHGIYPGCYYDKPFLEEQPVFTLDGSGSVIVSENVSFVQTLISTFTVSHVDFLGCNLLLSEEWLKYFDILSANSGCLVGASNDNTGNLKYGGDWILENTMEDVRDTYFTSQIEDLTTTLLTSTITTSVTILQANITGTYSWPVTILGTNITVTFGSNLTFTTTTQYFIIASSGVTIDGGNYTVTFSSVAGYSGLIQNGTSGAVGYSNTTIQNITVTNTTSSLAFQGGYLCQSYFGRGVGTVSNLINNCKNTGDIISSVANAQCGGLIGGFCAYNGGLLTVNNCSNSGSIGTSSTTSYAYGGLFGISAAAGPTTTSTLTGGILYVNNCSNSGYIYPRNSSGFFAEYAGYNGTIYINNCFNSGTIDDKDNRSGNQGSNGGFFTIQVGIYYGRLYMTNCYNTGNIIASQGGGLLGALAFYFGGSGTITNCYNLGNVSGSNAGGLVGSTPLYNDATTTAGTLTITNSYSIASYSGTNAGGLVGGYGAYDRGAVDYAGNLMITNCYCVGSATIVSPINRVATKTLSNNYAIASSWSDTAANTNLLNTPTSVYNTGSVWTSPAANTPYLLSSYTGNTYVQASSSFTGNLYVPNTASVVARSYTTSAVAYGTNLTLISVNLANPATYATINSTSGVISFSNLSAGTYVAKVLSYTTTNSQYTSYVFSTFTIVATTPPPYPLNTYNHTFYTYSSATPTVLTQTVYNSAGSLQSSTDISFGGQNIQTVLTALDVAPYTVGIRDTSNNKVSMDLAFFGAYNTTLTTTQQNAMITYVNTNYKEPRTAATNYAVTVSGGVFNINGVAQPNLTFVSGNLYVFDQSDATNIGNTLVLGTTLDVSSSIVGNNVVYNGTPGSANAYTLIDLSGTNPATTSLKYFSLTTTGLGFIQIPSYTNMVVWLDASISALADNASVSSITDQSPNPKTGYVRNVLFKTNGLKSGYKSYSFYGNTSSGILYNLAQNTFLSSVSPYIGGLTCFMVANFTSSSYQPIISTTSGVNFFDFYSDSRFLMANTLSVTLSPINFTSATYTNKPCLWYCTFSVTSTNSYFQDYLYNSSNTINPVTSNLQTKTTPSANYDTAGLIAFGSRASSSTSFDINSGVNISEVIVYNSALNTSNCNTIVNYLRNKWAI